jgi:hypothetical protein
MASVIQFRMKVERPVVACRRLKNEPPNVRIGVKLGNTREEQVFSAPHPIADIAGTGRHVGFVPGTEVAASFDDSIRTRD